MLASQTSVSGLVSGFTGPMVSAVSQMFSTKQPSQDSGATAIAPSEPTTSIESPASLPTSACEKDKFPTGLSKAGGAGGAMMGPRNIGGNIMDLVGNTPMVYLNKLTEGCHAKVAVKLEYFNPACSVKDRLTMGMIKDLEAKGQISPGKSTLVEATSGNTGIGLAAMGAMRGYKVVLVMPESMSLERRTLLKAYGAEVVLTPAPLGMKGAIQKANDVVRSTPGAVLTRQFETPSNAKIHRETTGPEIWRDTNGEVDIYVSGVGTGGTLTGVAQYLKTQGSKCKIVAVEPEESPVLSGGKGGPHKIQGIGAGFIPDVVDPNLIDEVIRVSSAKAIETAGSLPVKEGILSGISSGASVAAAIELAKRPENTGKLIVAVVPSFGERYLSSPLFAGVKDAASKIPTTKM